MCFCEKAFSNVTVWPKIKHVELTNIDIVFVSWLKVLKKTEDRHL